MITKVKSHQQTKKHRQQKYSPPLNVGTPQVPLPKKPPRKSLEKLEDWIDAS